MQVWNEIVQSALVGTQKLPLQISSANNQLADAIRTIQQNNSFDYEEQCLQIGSIVHQYQQAGIQFSKYENVSIAVAEQELLPYCNTNSQQLLIDALAEKSDFFTTLWLQLCTEKQQIIAPQALPKILNKTAQDKKLQPLVLKCMGKRGEWLCKFNTEWQFANTISDEELWQTGSLAQRKQIIQRISLENIELAISWIQQTWPQENAATKTAFLEAIQEHVADLSNSDWLHHLLSEKSVQVKNMVVTLLKKIPISTIIKQYQSIVQEAISVKKEKTLLGLSSKQVLHIQLSNPIPPEIFTMGIQSISNSKDISDETFIMFQLLQHTPPQALEAALQLDVDTIVQFFIQQKNIQPYLQALIHATVQFKNQQWAAAIMQQSKALYIELLPLLPIQQQEKYSIQFFKKNEYTIIENACNWQQEWSVEFTRLCIQFYAENPSMHSIFLNKAIACISSSCIHSIHLYTPSDAYKANLWQSNQEALKRLLQLKQNIIQSFQ